MNDQSLTQILETNCPQSWDACFNYCKEELETISKEIEKREASGEEIFPHKQHIFTAFHLTPVTNIKVIIFGQDPYHQMIIRNGIYEPRAMGLSFSVRRGDVVPVSLKNIYKELSNTVPGFVTPQHGDLSSWAQQGVLMLNSCLTVVKDRPNSHSKPDPVTKKKMWDPFIEKIMQCITHYYPNCIYVLWGNEARQLKSKLKLPPTSVILESVHPSGLSASRGFFGCNHFNLINQALIQQGKTPINWTL